MRATVGGFTFDGDGGYVDAEGRQWVLDSLDGWDGGVDVVAEEVQRPTSHGEFAEPGLRSGRLAILNGFVVCPDRASAVAAKRTLSALLADGQFADLEVLDDDGVALSASVRLGGTPAVLLAGWSNTVRVQLPMRAPNSLRYGPLFSASTPFPELVGGLRYPLYTDGSGALASYEWTGVPHASASVERVGGVETRRNLARVPRAGDALPWWHTAGAAGSLAVAAGPTPEAGVVEFSRLTFSLVPPNFVGVYYREEGLDGSAGDTVPISMWVRPSKDATIRLDSSTRFGSTTIATATSAEVFVSAGTWHRIEQPVTSSAAYNGCQGWVRVVDASTAFGPGDTLDVAAVLVGATGRYFDGDTPARDTSSVVGWLDYGPPSTSGTVTLVNPGTADAHPQFEVTGPAPGFEIVKVGTGDRLVYDARVPAGSRLVIDTATGVTVMDGVSDRTLTWQDPMTVAPGESAEFAFVPRGATTEAVLRASIRPAYW